MTKFAPEELLIESYDSRQLYSSNFGFHMPRGVKVTHLATGLVVTEDSHRHQHKNKELALQKLAELVDTPPDGE